MVNAANWDNVYSSNDVNMAYDAFWSTYIELFNLNFPLKKMRFNKNIHGIKPFMTKGLLKSRETKKNLFMATLTDRSPPTLQHYKNYKNLYFKTLRAMKKLHYSSKFEENAKNSKKTWDTINEVQRRSKKSESVDKININGALETDPLKIATEFNSFFTRVGKQISNSIPPVSKAPEDYINYNRNIPNLNLGNTTPEHIKKVISKFQPKTSCDVQGQSTKMIKFISNEISRPLSHVFNLSLSQGVFPEKLKKCRVIPVYKSGDQLDVDNYRLISLLSSISKILEKIVADKLIYHLLSNDLLYNHQYGFLPKKSTEQNLLHIVNYITNALNDGMFCVGVFLDLRKAFDVCSLEILLKKLKKMGIQGNAHKWFESYLTNRSQCVDIAGIFSDQINLDILVIQGSTLGPILFLCYINDFWTATSLFSVLFADDTTCLAKGYILSELTAYVNDELRKIANWFRSNKMALNTSKTKFMIFRTRGKNISEQDCQLVLCHPLYGLFLLPGHLGGFIERCS
jgi:hypothetical protein